ncbi:MAG: hypothetical protein ABFR89_02400 [Actinomycetota bacterium]
MFYHFTAERRALQIDGWLRRFPQQLLFAEPLIWVTDLADPQREAVGLTSHRIPYDRMATRFTLEPWSEGLVKRWLGSALQQSTPAHVLEMLHEGAAPEHWFIVDRPVAVVGGVARLV